MSIDEMQFGFMPKRGTFDAVFILRRVSHQRKKIVYLFCGPRESFRQSTKESVVMGIEEKRNKRGFG